MHLCGLTLTFYVSLDNAIFLFIIVCITWSGSIRKKKNVLSMYTLLTPHNRIVGSLVLDMLPSAIMDISSS